MGWALWLMGIILRERLEGGEPWRIIDKILNFILSRRKCRHGSKLLLGQWQVRAGSTEY
jgi:hypothetical protein